VAAMATSEQTGLLAAIVKSSDDAIVSKDLKGYVTSWNEAAERLFGYTEEEMVGQHITKIIPIERLAEEDQVLATIRSGDTVDHFQTQRRRKDGTLVDISLTVSPVRSPDGRVIGASKIARDITEQKRLQAALEEANRAKDVFLAMLGHELRNPLAPILTALRLIQLNESDAARPEFKLIERQVQHMVALVNDLLDVARIGRGPIQLRNKPVELAQIVTEAIEMTDPLFVSRRHKIACDVPAKGLVIDVDARRVTQVVANLLANAAKFTHPGGSIWITGAAVDDGVGLTVRDNGTGITAEMLPRVFDAFAQQHQSSDRQSGGLGLGLTIVRNLVNLHGGRVVARSAGRDQGAEFEVWFPSAERGLQPDEGEQAGANHASKTFRVLIVDDNQDAGLMLSDYLGSFGHATRVAIDGPSALKAAEQFRPDVALLDIGLPGMDGYVLGERLRASGLTARLIAVSGYGQPADKSRSANIGFERHFVKPVDLDELQAQIVAGAH
jgi:PAS domain S-box-containing protein